jgi:hypothetical protein
MFLKIGHRDHEPLESIVNKLYCEADQEGKHEISYISNLFVVFLGKNAVSHENKAQENQGAVQEVGENTAHKTVFVGVFAVVP